ncbi:MAG TPA: histidinol dehydrogenase [Longimicrobiales bacterium]|nr:histidinol dehydrogenase [Longimicrobiales bacterium]
MKPTNEAEWESGGAEERRTEGSPTPPLPHSPTLAVTGRLAELTAEEEALLLNRGRASDPEVEAAVRALIDNVRRRGDAALREQALRFDRASLESLEVPREAWDEALEGLEPAARAALEQAADNIAAFHRAQLPPPLEVEVTPGVRLGRRAEPLERVAVYAPGGRAAYPSSVLMGVVPARVAGVGEVVVCSPAGPDGRPPAAVLAACALAGADRVFAVGGAGAIAAVAYGTETIPRCDKVVGPGNAYVTEAKRQLNGRIAIDSPAGPSEVLVIADGAADPEVVAAELICQAEHDPDAAAVLVCTVGRVLEATLAALARRVPAEPRREIVEAALAARGGLLLADSLEEALAFSARYAPEHLLLLVRDPRAALDGVRAAGTVFLGAGSSVAFGDYVTGANHVLPTAGLARSYPGLSTLDFLRWFTYQEVSRDAAARLAGPTATLAEAEGLPAHAAAARLRTAEGESGRVEEGVIAPAGGSRPGTSPRPPLPHSPALPFRAAYRDIELYDPARRPIGLDLSDNTSLYGAPPAAMRALRELSQAQVTRYPPVFAERLKEALAELHGVQPENIATGCGSDDVIDSALRAFCEPGDVVAYPEPTFSMVPLFVQMNAARPVGVPMAPGFALDVDAVLSTRARAIYLCTPNNPTGMPIRYADIVEVVDAATGVVLVDEAYADYGAATFIGGAIESGRAVVLRTLSKAFGLAGLRIGYAIGAPALVREIEKSRGPYKISAAAEAAALAALAEDREWAAANVADVVRNREALVAELEGMGLRVWPSAANFLLVRAGAGEGGAAGRLLAALRERDVAVRAFPGLPQAGDCIRVSIGPWPAMERFVDALRGALEMDAGEERA